MIKNISISAATTIFVLLLIFHPWLVLLAAYLSAGFFTIYCIGSELGTEKFRWPSMDQIEIFFVFFIMAFVWPILVVIILTCEGYIQFHKPITFHKPKPDDAKVD